MKLLASEIRCLIRTDIAMREWMGHIISDKEAAAYASGPETSETTWRRLKRAGYVRNVSGVPGVMITENGKRELRRLGL